MITSISLDQLSCISESEGGGSHPYLWAVLLQVDDETIKSGARAATVGFAPSPTGAQLAIDDGMRAGDTAAIPVLQVRMAARFDSAEHTKHLILVAALLDHHDTPFDAILAGYDAFLGATQEQVAAHVFELGSTSKDVQAAAKDEVKAAVNTAVNDAISAKLTLWDKIMIKIHYKTPDSTIGNGFIDFDLTSAVPPPFNLAFGSGSAHDYRIDGTIAVSNDPCESEFVRVRAARQTVANTQAALKNLLAHESSSNQKQIEKLEDEVAAQQALLAAAQADLNQCLAIYGHAGDPTFSESRMSLDDLR
jgi:hypothetical protein